MGVGLRSGQTEEGGMMENKPDLLTLIVIRHPTVEALKSSQLWTEIMRLAWAGEDVEVIEIAEEEAVPE